jgi:hypothetical protein
MKRASTSRRKDSRLMSRNVLGVTHLLSNAKSGAMSFATRQLREFAVQL